MQIDWAEFSLDLSLLSGKLIVLAALPLMLANGRVMGVSSILGGLLGKAETKNWRLAFIAGAILAPVFMVQSGLYDIPVQRVANGATLYIAAFLVGFGTAIGSGCTSGHGICGLSRLSARSFVAVAIFVTTAIITVYMFRHGVS